MTWAASKPTPESSLSQTLMLSSAVEPAFESVSVTWKASLCGPTDLPILTSGMHVQVKVPKARPVAGFLSVPLQNAVTVDVSGWTPVFAQPALKMIVHDAPGSRLNAEKQMVRVPSGLSVLLAKVAWHVPPITCASLKLTPASSLSHTVTGSITVLPGFETFRVMVTS